MARLYLFAEGYTEQTFASNVLKPHLANMGVYLEHVMLIAHARKGGITHRGGGRKYIPMRNDISRILAQEKSWEVFFTTMIDLYAIHIDFPGLADAERLRHLPDKRVEALERSFADDIGDSRFIPYIQLHEFEAYLFSDPTKFSFFYEHHEKEISKLKATADGKTTPELINDGPHSAPSKRIIAVLPDYEGAKRVVGPQVAERIGLDVIRSKCPHFNVWLSRLEQLDKVR
ncbi:MAG: DUF4276 family protein [Acidobacteria bacterium]|jgi:hypothetical protein|nr:DUF4276 family protein [Acidobacteriota bacterium]